MSAARSDLAFGDVIAFDQTINNTGWAHLRNSPARGLIVMDTGMIRPPADELKSFEASFSRALYVQGQVALLLGWSEALPVVCERPAMYGKRIESSLLTCYAIHVVTRGGVVLMDNRHAKKVIIGRAGSKKQPVTKSHVREAVEMFWDGKPDNLLPGRPWNEHTIDAVMLGLAYLYDLNNPTTKGS